jgi:hypothetical protein
MKAAVVVLLIWLSSFQTLAVNIVPGFEGDGLSTNVPPGSVAVKQFFFEKKNQKTSTSLG